MKLLQSSTIFKQKVIMKCLVTRMFASKFFTTPNSKNIIATLCIVTVEISELTCLLILHFHVITKQCVQDVSNNLRRADCKIRSWWLIKKIKIKKN